VPTDPLTGSRYPASSAAPNVPQDIQNAVFDLADNTTVGCTTPADRDSKFAAWVNAGGVMRDGLRCYVASIDQLQVYEGNAWRFEKYIGPLSAAAAPITNITANPPIPNNTGTDVKGWTVDRSHPSASVNTSTGLVTFNQRGIWSIVGGCYSDYGAEGHSAVSMVLSGAAYPFEDSKWRRSGAPLAGVLRQPLAFTGHIDVGATWRANVFQTNPDGLAVNYLTRFTIQLIG
jgi:hypothetical protein